MNLPKNPIILIPARMGSVRLPNKPLAIINGDPMIVHVWQRAIEANLGRVVVACGEDEILKVIEKAGGEAVLTDPNEPSGSDRIFSALQTLDPSCEHDAVINIQGDLPVLESSTIESAWMLLASNNVVKNKVKTSLQTQAHQLPNQSPHQVLALLLPCENHHEKDLNMNYYLHHLTQFSAKSNHKAFLSVTKVHIL